jgi:hypothetical protein
MRFLGIACRFVCYAALAVVASGIAALVYVVKMGGCPRLDEGSVECISPFYEAVGGYGMSVVMATVFTGLPGILALAGLVMLIRGIWWRWGRSSA